MARPRKFDEDDVLSASAGLFRVNGFADTSTEQLCEASGLGRSSLYNTFDSKDELFVRSLEHYTAATRARQEEILSTPDTTAAERIRMLLEAIVDEEDEAARHDHAAGCMTVNTLMAPDHRRRDNRVDSILSRDLQLRLDSLTSTIRMGIADGSVTDSLTPEAGAWLVITVVSGIRVSAQAGADPPTLRRVALAGVHALYR